MDKNKPYNQAKRYPEDALLGASDIDVINTGEVSTLDQLFRERVRRSPDKIAYTQFSQQKQQWQEYTWSNIAEQVERWQVALNQEKLEKGDKVAIRFKNSIEWVIFDQAALRLGLVVVPLYIADRPDNVSYVLHNSHAKLVLLGTQAEWQDIADSGDDLSAIKRVVCLSDSLSNVGSKKSAICIHVDKWLPEQGQHMERGLAEANDLASIVYTSGTTGKPKGVMLSHKNMLANAYSGMRSMVIKQSDTLLSFLPLSHTLERTVGYYASLMCGAKVVYNRSIPQLGDDLLYAKPTVLISVPRIFERVHNKINIGLHKQSKFKQLLFHKTVKIGWRRFLYQQGQASWHPSLLLWPILNGLVAKKVRAKLGGNLRFAIVGGAPLSPAVSKTFIALEILLLQGYGLTESSPVVSVNTAKDNRPDSIGLPLRGVEVFIGENDELIVRGDNVMLGYWQNKKATLATMLPDGWLKTGDKAAIDEQGFIRIVGRIKDILVLANGEKVPPADIEAAINEEELFEQVLVVGEGKPYLSLLAVLNKSAWKAYSKKHGYSNKDLQSEAVHEKLLEKAKLHMVDFPGYARIHKICPTLEEWTLEDGLVTATLKKKREKIKQKFSKEIANMYQGH